MERSKLIYAIYLAFLLLFMGLVVATPYIAFSDAGLARSLYSGFAPTCHQKMSRSLCLFNTSVVSIGDCTNQAGTYVANDRQNTSVTSGSAIGFKFPVCARDVGIYGFMLIGALVYPFIFKLDEKRMLPPLLLIAAITPLAIDGGIQLLGDVGVGPFIGYESTNLLRLITGGLAGFVASIYVIPILNKLFG